MTRKLWFLQKSDEKVAKRRESGGFRKGPAHGEKRIVLTCQVSGGGLGGGRRLVLRSPNSGGIEVPTARQKAGCTLRFMAVGDKRNGLYGHVKSVLGYHDS